MITSNIIICELKGSINSNPCILGSYPVDIKDKKSMQMIPKFFPFGSEPGDFLTNKFDKNLILSYIFTIKKINERDDLMSISIIFDKKENLEIYKLVLIEIIESLSNNQLLTEENLKKYLPIIFKGIYEECNIEIDAVKIELHKIIENARAKYIKRKPNIRGSFSL
ncbi:MAG: hypothetical protein ACFFAQ_13620 [Promethearchaeota archaeon]